MYASLHALWIVILLLQVVHGTVKPWMSPLRDCVMDTSLLVVTSAVDENLTLSFTSDECYKCPFQYVSDDKTSVIIPPKSNSSFQVSTHFPVTLKLETSALRNVCTQYFKYAECGVYTLNVVSLSPDNLTAGTCELQINAEGQNSEIRKCLTNICLV
ncbi:uncharacterized protein LOC106157991 [Lingula anatina]|uniref:Uncharacterized protein LOC106157991 n=1 Tax=Lingula anatina TaxID=7574 RepID=A0A1S3HTB0_LINAN|nr:uncharacterized protein LOC106157991 [Lingula anatina]|eukprot:XP_013389272.1 uncharacterized protein LOC106157991 [Lingula anatina]